MRDLKVIFYQNIFRKLYCEIYNGNDVYNNQFNTGSIVKPGWQFV